MRGEIYQNNIYQKQIRTFSLEAQVDEDSECRMLSYHEHDTEYIGL